MSRSLLTETLQKIQNDYLFLLKNNLDGLNTDNFTLIIDEINIFWETNRKFVELALYTIGKEYDCYVFTGASYLDIDDAEHFPFISLGNFHIVDDPIPRYLTTILSIKSNEFFKELKEQIVLSFEDNIKILENHSENILILPVRSLSKDISELMKLSNKIFLSLFNELDLTIEKFIRSFSSIKDIEKALSENTKMNLSFLEDEDSKDSLSERFKEFADITTLPYPNNSEAYNFLFIVQGNILQSLTIYLMCADYNLIPYIKYDVTFNYILLLGNIYLNDSNTKNILFKCIISHILYKHYDKKLIKKVKFSNYVKWIKKIDLNNKVYNEIEQKQINIDTGGIDEIVTILKKWLRQVLKNKNLFYRIFSVQGR